MPRPRNESLEIAERRQKVAALYLRGRTQREIAAAVDVDQATVSRDLKAVQKEWSEQAQADLAERKAVELAKIDELERTYHEGWERSCKEREKRRAKKIDAADPDRSRAETGKETENRDGDPRFLEGVRWCIEMRCKLLGLVVKKHEHSGRDGAAIPITFIEVPSGAAAPDRGADPA